MAGRPKTIFTPQTNLTVMIDSELFREVRKHIRDTDKTMKTWVLQALLEKVAREQRAK